MKKDQLGEILEVQKKVFIEDKNIEEAEYEEVQSIINSLVETKNKIKALKGYVDNYSEEILKFMKRNHLDLVYSAKGKATHKISDISAIKKDLVLIAIAEFENGERDSLTYEDVAETTERAVFSVKGITLDGE